MYTALALTVQCPRHLVRQALDGVGVLTQWPSHLHAPLLTTLDLRDCFAHPDALRTAISTLPVTLRRLTLCAAHHFGADMASHLACRIRDGALPELRGLDLSLCALGEEGSRCIVEALGGAHGGREGCPMLDSLRLKMVMGGDALLEAVVRVVQGGGMARVRELVLSGNEAWRVDAMQSLEQVRRSAPPSWDVSFCDHSFALPSGAVDGRSLRPSSKCDNSCVRLSVALQMLTQREDKRGDRAPVFHLPLLRRLLLVEKYGGGGLEWEERRRIRYADTPVEGQVAVAPLGRPRACLH